MTSEKVSTMQVSIGEGNQDQYLIGVLHGSSPKIAIVGVGTSRPLPVIVRNALVSRVAETFQVSVDGLSVIDHNQLMNKPRTMLFRRDFAAFSTVDAAISQLGSLLQIENLPEQAKANMKKISIDRSVMESGVNGVQAHLAGIVSVEDKDLSPQKKQVIQKRKGGILGMLSFRKPDQGREESISRQFVKGPRGY